MRPTPENPRASKKRKRLPENVFRLLNSATFALFPLGLWAQSQTEDRMEGYNQICDITEFTMPRSVASGKQAEMTAEVGDREGDYDNLCKQETRELRFVRLENGEIAEIIFQHGGPEIQHGQATYTPDNAVFEIQRICAEAIQIGDDDADNVVRQCKYLLVRPSLEQIQQGAEGVIEGTGDLLEEAIDMIGENAGDFWDALTPDDEEASG